MALFPISWFSLYIVNENIIPTAKYGGGTFMSYGSFAASRSGQLDIAERTSYMIMLAVCVLGVTVLK